MNNKKIVGLVLLLLVSLTSYAGGGWTKQKGKTYIKVSGWWVESKGFFSGNGRETSTSVESGLFNLNVYAEYGFTDKLTAIAYVPFFTRSYRNDLTTINTNGEELGFQKGGSLNSFGDSEIGVKYSIFKKGRFALAGSLILGIPLGNDSGSNDPDNKKFGLATGDGEFNQMLRADLGISLYNSDTFDLYSNVYVGVNNRTKDFSDEFRAGLEVGAGILNSKLWIVSKLDMIESFENEKSSGTAENASVFANNSEVLNFTAEAAYYITKKIGISAAISNPLSGQNVFNGPAYTAGIFFDTK